MANPLSATGGRRLVHYETIIERGLATFQQVGDALLAIRDEKLYRAEFDTFETYCKTRWGISDRRARQLMDAAEIGTVVPVDNEAQARELAPIKDDPDAMRQVVAQAESEGKTASSLRKYVKHFKNAEADAGLPPSDGSPEAAAEAAPVDGATADGGEGADALRDREAVSLPSSIVPDQVTSPCPHCNGTGFITVRAS